MAKSKIVDLNPKPEKITAPELERVQKVVSDINRAQMEVGRLETQKHMLLHDVTQLQVLLKEVQEQLEKEYGTVDISIEDGSIKYPDNEQADS
tara:strand:+ start:36 stop:314 length:279 start_codon:yes stop_codon:yes gene_type:complete